MRITVKDGSGNTIAAGTLVVNTSVNPTTATFTPDNGTLVNCNGVVWTSNANGAVRFNFQVSGQANGNFPLGPNGNSHIYNFTGTQNSNGFPNGSVNFPPASAAGDESDTWQATATVGEEEEAETKRKDTYGATAS